MCSRPPPGPWWERRRSPALVRAMRQGTAVRSRVETVAGVVCGNVKTANATVYTIDSVLMPK
ncbi:hypothetical protein [Actinomadura sp. HBU206391]|uniref:hypothetical protein n=1 Tax=Actinomadura sp. HBU206391 TaxID=2731692 RepID=UPI0021C76D1B|nr:hypothetical protein [Actinomadura sp. HBU206391]